MRIEYFCGSTFGAGRGECLRALIAAIYRTAKIKPHFTTDDVFENLSAEYDAADFRKTTGSSKLIAVALNKVRNKGDIYLSALQLWVMGDELCHGRRKRQWVSKVCAV